MVRFRRLLIAGIAGFAAVLSTSGSLAAFADSVAGCDGGGFYEGCPVTSGTSDGTGVDVTGTIDREHNGSGAGSGTGAGGPGRALTDAEIQALLDETCVGNGVCGLRTSLMLNPLIPDGDPADPTAGDAPVVVAISDLARFLPAAASLHAEPDGWAVVGVPANFWADASAVTVSGSLLGETAQVRFMPQAYRFDYGDGSARTTATPGTSWAALGQEELTATPTSHVYAARGDRKATVTVIYSAEYRFAGGAWIGVAGAVSGTTPTQRVLVVVERTALTTPA